MGRPRQRGEVFVENHRNSYNTPYKFNGKELDDETGYYYYGARYYNPRVSLWLNVDPLAEKFAGRSPYEYTFSNPINLTDPTGMGPEDPRFHKVRRGDNLMSISRKYGVSVKDLAYMNGISNINKLKTGQLLSVNPELDYTKNPQGGYSNKNRVRYQQVFYDSPMAFIRDWAKGNGSQNILIGGDFLQDIQGMQSLQELKQIAFSNIMQDGNIEAGETYNGYYRIGKIYGKTGREIISKAISDVFSGEDENEFTKAQNVLGSYGFSMRVNKDGKSVTIGVYDSKTIESGTDHIIKGLDPNKGNFKTRYLRAVWTEKIPQQKK